MTLAIRHPDPEDALYDSIACFADDLIERAADNGMTGSTMTQAILEQIRWTCSKAIQELEVTHL